MSWIETITPENANTKLKSIYSKYFGNATPIDNVMLVHSLRPNTLKGHIELYKNTLHNIENDLPKWFLELIGTYTSFLNKCHYCFEHHSNNILHLLEDKSLVIQMMVQLENDTFTTELFSEKEIELLNYAKKLTLKPSLITKTMVNKLKAIGITDAEILEVNQVVAYFNYANRTVLGLGVALEHPKNS